MVASHLELEEFSKAKAAATTAHRIGRDLQDIDLFAHANWYLVRCLDQEREYKEAALLIEETRNQYKRLSDERLTRRELDTRNSTKCELICTLADVRVHQEQFREAERLYRERIELSKKVGEGSNDLVAWGYMRLGRMYYKQGKLGQALRQLEQGIRISEELTDRLGYAHALYWKSRILFEISGGTRGKEDLLESYRLFRTHNAIGMIKRSREYLSTNKILPTEIAEVNYFAEIRE